MYVIVNPRISIMHETHFCSNVFTMHAYTVSFQLCLFEYCCEEISKVGYDVKIREIRNLFSNYFEIVCC